MGDLTSIKFTSVKEIKNQNVRKNSTNLDRWIHRFCFLSVLFIGADKWGLDVGVNLRLDQIFLLILTVLLFFRNRYIITVNFWVMLFAVTSLISTLLAFDIFRGALFYCSIIYNILFVFYAFYNYVKLYGIETLIKILRKTLYCQFVLMLIQVILKIVFNYELSFLPAYGEYLGVPRFSLWFYEPSYLSTYLSFWFSFSLYMYLIGNDKNYLKDIIIALVMFFFSTSTTGFVAILISCLIIYIIWLFKGFTIGKIIFPLIVFCCILLFKLCFSSVYDVFFARLFNQSLDSASGGRVSSWYETWEVFKKNILFGVGPGNYGLYLGQDAGTVPSNVTLELMSTLGIFATIAFYGLTISLCVKAYILNYKLKTKNTILLASCALGLLIFTVILQANQGYLRLYHWMFFGVMCGGESLVCGQNRVKECILKLKGD